MGARFSAPVQTGSGAHPASCTMGTGSFPGVKSGRAKTLTPHPLLAPWSRKGRAIPLLPLWAIRPVQNLSSCTRVHFTIFTIMRREVYALFTDSGNTCKALICVFAPVFVRVSILYSNVVIEGDNKNTAAAAASSSQPTKTKLWWWWWWWWRQWR